MPFFDNVPIPKHHGQALKFEPERLLKPTPAELETGILEKSASFGRCLLSDCRQRVLYVRERRLIGWGKPRRVKEPGEYSSLIKRMQLADESHFVLGSAKDETYRLMRFPV